MLLPGPEERMDVAVTEVIATRSVRRIRVHTNFGLITAQKVSADNRAASTSCWQAPWGWAERCAETVAHHYSYGNPPDHAEFWATLAFDSGF